MLYKKLKIIKIFQKMHLVLPI